MKLTSNLAYYAKNLSMCVNKVFALFFSAYKSILSYFLSLARSRYAKFWILLFSYLEAIFFPIPPDAFLIARGIAKSEGILRLALLVTVFSVLGGATSYILGAWFFNSFGLEMLNMFGLQQVFDKIVLQLSADVAFWTNFIFGFTILPFKMIALASGFVSVPITTFLLAAVCARGARMIIIALLLKIYGSRLRSWLDSRQAFVLSMLLACLCLLVLVLYVSV